MTSPLTAHYSENLTELFHPAGFPLNRGMQLGAVGPNDKLGGNYGWILAKVFGNSKVGVEWRGRLAN